MKLSIPRVSIRKAAIILFGVAVACTAGAIGIRTLIERSISPEQVRVLASEALGRDVTAETVEVSAIYGLILRGVTISEKSDTLLFARTVRITPNWPGLLQGRFDVARVRVIDGDLYVRKETETWNVVRLANQLSSRDTAAPIFLAADELRVRFSGRGETWDSWTVLFEEIVFEDELTFTVASLNDEICKIKGSCTFEPLTGEIEFENLPRGLAAFDKRIDFENLSGGATFTFTDEFVIKGTLAGDRLSFNQGDEGPIRLTNFRAREIEARMGKSWNARIDNLKSGSVKLTATFDGTGSRLRRGKIEWEGAIERMLEILPEREAAALLAWRPRGSSAGYILIGEAASFSVNARGLSIRTPQSFRLGPANEEITDIRGRFEYAGSNLSFDSVALKYGGDALRISGKTTTTDSPRYDLQIETERFDAARISSFLPLGVTLAGKIGGSVHVRPASVTGRMIFLGTDIAHAGKNLKIGKLTGELEVLGDRMIARNLAGDYLGAPAKIDGTIPLADSLPYALTLSLGRARLEHLADFAPEGFSASGPAEALTLSVRGAPSAPSFTGSIRMAGATVRLPFLENDLTDVRGEADFTSDSFASKSMTFKTGATTIRFSGGAENFSDPVLRSVVVRASDARLDDLVALLPAERRPMPAGAEITGTVDIDSVRIDGPIEKARWAGAIVLKNVGAELPGLDKGVTGVKGRVVFGDGKAKADNLAGRLGSADVRLAGEMALAEPYALSVKLVMQAADLAELWSAIPKPDAWNAMVLTGNANIIASLDFSEKILKLRGDISDAAIEGFGMSFESVRGAFQYENEKLSLSSLTADWAGGKASNGIFEIDLGQNPPAFKAAGAVSGAELARMITYGGYAAAGYSGIVSAEGSISGRYGMRESLNGRGSVDVRRARFEKLAPLNGLSRTLRMDFFSRGTYESAKGNFTIEKGVVKTVAPEHFRFSGENFTLEARGYTTLEGECVYNYACGVEAGPLGNIMTTLRLSRLFAMDGEGGILRTSGTIRGRIDNPVVKTDLGILNVFR